MDDTVKKYSNYHINEKEELAIKVVEVVHELRNLIKRRKKDQSVINTVSDYLAEMLRGSGQLGDSDLDLLELLVKTAQKSLAAKIEVKNIIFEEEETEEFVNEETPKETKE